MKKAVVLLHEIYGVNNHIQQYKSEFIALGYDVYCPNLLQLEQSFPYEQEQQAYAHFMNDIGFEKGFAQVQNLILELKDTCQQLTTKVASL